MESKIGVVLMTYGSATTAEHVEEYFKSIYPSGVRPELIEEFKRRYALIESSPLIEITKRQAALLEESLGSNYIVRVGMRHLSPSIEEAVGECIAAGATKLVGLILSPQYSHVLMEAYQMRFLAAAGATPATLAQPWPAEPAFVSYLAEAIKQEPEAPLVFTTHSMPLRVIENDPTYLSQLEETIHAVMKEVGEREWHQAYQSAGHSPEPWLTPDLTDVLNSLSSKQVLIVPIQFLADHLEVLYDLDIAAKGQCVERGITYGRIPLPNTAPGFILALEAVARRATGTL